MTNCDVQFQKLTSSYNEIPLVFFQETDCYGEPVQVIFPNNDNVTKLPVDTPIKSFIIPENVKVYFFKTNPINQEILFNKQMWGLYIDNTEMSLDTWTIRNSISEIKDTFANITHIRLENQGPRQFVIASSCVGEGRDEYIPNYDPELNKQNCDQFLDVFCQLNDPYTRKLCKLRKLVTDKEIMEHEQTIANTIIDDTNESNESNYAYKFFIFIIIIIMSIITIFVTFLIARHLGNKHTVSSNTILK